MLNDTVRANAQAMPADRRAVLSSLLAAGTVATVPAVTIAARVAAQGDEARIFALLEELKRIRQVFRAGRPARERSESDFSAIVRAVGYEAAKEQRAHIETGCDAAWRKGDRLIDRMGAISMQMLALRPATLSGFAAIAEGLKVWAASHYWDDPEDDRDWDILHVTKFIDLAISLGGRGLS